MPEKSESAAAVSFPESRITTVAEIAPYLSGFKELLSRQLSARRYAHCLNVADSAFQLAERYGFSPELAYCAGLLHDIMKEAPVAGQLKIIQSHGIELNSVELREKKLLHAPAGAAYVFYEMNVGDTDFFNSVRYHTTGRAGMSLLEKIIYIADYISEEREYDGVEDMRVLAQESLEAAMLYALKFCIVKQASDGRLIEPNSVACYNELIINTI